METQWYYRKDGQKLGPVSSRQLKELAASGQLQPTDMIWREKLPKWAEARKVQGLFPRGNPVNSPNPQMAFSGEAAIPPAPSLADSLPASAGSTPAKEAAGTGWFIRVGIGDTGPLSNEELRELARQGVVKPDTLVSSDRSSWCAATDVAGLPFDAAHATAASAAEHRLRECRVVKCWECGIEVATEARSCPNCGAPAPAKENGRSARESPQPPGPPPASGVPIADRARDARAVVDQVKSGAPVATADQPPTSPVASLPSLTSKGKRNLLVAFILGSFFLPSFGGQVDTAGVWFLALLGTVVSCVVYALFCEPDKEEWGPAVLAFFFTAIVGPFVLLQILQPLANLAASMPVRSGGPLQAVWLILSVVGNSYARAFRAFGHDPVREQLSFWGTFFALIPSVGLCEELVKLTPVVFALKNGIVATFRGTLFVGLLSGLGFGIAEGLSFSFNYYQPQHSPLSQYLTRFIGLAFSHGTLVMLSTSLLFYWRQEVFEACRKTAQAVPKHFSWLAAAAPVVGVALVSAVPHALYDAFAFHRMPQLAGLTTGAVIWTAFTIERAGHHPTSPRSSESPTQYEQRSKK